MSAWKSTIAPAVGGLALALLASTAVNAAQAPQLDSGTTVQLVRDGGGGGHGGGGPADGPGPRDSWW